MIHSFVAVVEVVLGQQVVVARDGRHRAGGEGRLDPGDERHALEVPVRDANVVARRTTREVAVGKPEHVEVVAEARAGVEPPERRGDPCRHPRLGEGGVRHRPPVDPGRARGRRSAGRGRPPAARRPRPRRHACCGARSRGRRRAGPSTARAGGRNAGPDRRRRGSSGWSAPQRSGRCESRVRATAERRRRRSPRSQAYRRGIAPGGAPGDEPEPLRRSSVATRRTSAGTAR